MSEVFAIFAVFQQFLFDKHIQSQLEERDFLRITADEIVQKVYHLEKIVRKEKGDHNPESPLTEPPVWRQDLSEFVQERER